MVYIVGAGSGDPELITVKGERLLKAADVVIYAGSLVNPALLKLCRENCEIHNSASMTLPEVLAVMKRAEEEGKLTVRLHTGDGAIYGAIQEQMDALDEMGISFEVVPGVSSFLGAAAALRQEYTLPGVSQTVIITRQAGRTPVPPRESLSALATHHATMCIFLSVDKLAYVVRELTAGGYEETTPIAIVFKATWPEEKILRGTLATIVEIMEKEAIDRTAMIVVGDCLASGYEKSRLYAADFSHMFRKATAESADK